jgi:hypothetical protein
MSAAVAWMSVAKSGTVIPHCASLHAGYQIKVRSAQRSEPSSTVRSFATARAHRPEFGERVAAAVSLAGLTGIGSRPASCAAMEGLRDGTSFSHSRLNRARCSAFSALSARSLSALWRLRSRATALSQALRAVAVRLGPGGCCTTGSGGAGSGGAGSGKTGTGGGAPVASACDQVARVESARG